jgi:predicted ribosome quality control (RQC) complex YloA/Tae2 family protein
MVSGSRAKKNRASTRSLKEINVTLALQVKDLMNENEYLTNTLKQVKQELERLKSEI